MRIGRLVPAVTDYPPNEDWSLDPDYQVWMWTRNSVRSRWWEKLPSKLKGGGIEVHVPFGCIKSVIPAGVRFQVSTPKTLDSGYSLELVPIKQGAENDGVDLSLEVDGGDVVLDGGGKANWFFSEKVELPAVANVAAVRKLNLYKGTLSDGGERQRESAMSELHSSGKVSDKTLCEEKGLDVCFERLFSILDEHPLQVNPKTLFIPEDVKRELLEAVAEAKRNPEACKVVPYNPETMPRPNGSLKVEVETSWEKEWDCERPNCMAEPRNVRVELDGKPVYRWIKYKAGVKGMVLVESTEVPSSYAPPPKPVRKSGHVRVVKILDEDDSWV